MWRVDGYGSPSEPTWRDIVNLAAAAILLGGIGVTTIPPWVQLAVSGAILAIVVWVNIVSKIVRHWQMRRPVTAYFQTTDEDVGSTRSELRIKAHSEAHIELRMVPRLHFVQNEIIVGVKGPKATRPTIEKMESRFVRRGLNMKASPETTEGHYIDQHDRYHIKERADRTKGNTYALGFVITAREPGVYLVEVELMHDDGEGEASSALTLRVE